jgi:hypothetical protein
MFILIFFILTESLFIFLAFLAVNFKYFGLFFGAFMLTQVIGFCKVIVNAFELYTEHFFVLLIELDVIFVRTVFNLLEIFKI